MHDEPPAPPPETPSSGIMSPNRRMMIVLSYLWALALVPLLVESDDSEVQWHAKHGLVLFGAEIGVYIVISFLAAATEGLGCLLLPLTWLGVLVLHVACMGKGLQGNRLRIPGLSHYTDQF